MAITRRARGSRSRAIIAAGLLAAAAIAAIPARSAVPVAPTLVSTSVGETGGWSDGKAVLARFDVDIRHTGTTAAVTEADGTAVAGVVSTAPAEFNLRHDVIVWRPDLTGRVDEFGAPLRALPEGNYRVTFTAVSSASNLSTTVGPIDFRVDNKVPFNPIFTAPEFPGPAASGDVEITGVISDRPGPGAANAAFRSGITKVMLFFWNSADPMTYDDTSTPIVIMGDDTGQRLPIYQAQEIRSLRRGAALIPCTSPSEVAGCTRFNDSGVEVLAQDFEFSATVDLGPGLWTVKAVASDRAGNASQEVTTQFIVL